MKISMRTNKTTRFSHRHSPVFQVNMFHYSRSLLTTDDDDNDDDLFDLMSRRIELQHSISPYRHRPLRLVSIPQRRFASSPYLEFPRLNFDNDSISPLPQRSNPYVSQSIEFARFNIENDPIVRRSRRPKRRQWKSVGFILIFYFHLKRNVRRAKTKSTYYQRDFHRLRFLELLTAVHRVYFEPNSILYKCLSIVVHRQTFPMMKLVEVFLSQLINFRPQYGILGTSSDESVLIYLLQCSLNVYPRNYFWSIERHLLTLSYTKMNEFQQEHLDHFTTKFIVISTFIFRGLNKTLLLKPIKYRLTRGELTEKQLLNIRMFSSLILSIARHAIIRKKRSNSFTDAVSLRNETFFIR